MRMKIRKTIDKNYFALSMRLFQQGRKLKRKFVFGNEDKKESLY
jgi:hypothetical protein